MAWRVAKSLQVLRAEVNRMAPGRSKASDGTLGDAAHASRSSDHNPYIIDANGIGVVRALDITHDPDGGCDAHAIAEHVRKLGQAGDPRVRYVISNRRIASPRQGWAWRRYSGSNPHSKHAHVSVVEGVAYDSTRPWGIANTQEDDMPLSDDDINRVAARVDQALQDDWQARDAIQQTRHEQLVAVLDRIARKLGAYVGQSDSGWVEGELIDSGPSWRPTRKVTAGTLALLAWEVLQSVLVHEVGLDLHDATWSALNVLLPAAVAYWTPEGP